MEIIIAIYMYADAYIDSVSVTRLNDSWLWYKAFTKPVSIFNHRAALYCKYGYDLIIEIQTTLPFIRNCFNY